MVSQRPLQQENTRLQVLRLLDDNPKMSTRQLADAVGISNGSAYYLLNALVQKGLVKLQNFAAAEHKGRYAYILTPRGLVEKSSLTKRFLRRKREEYGELAAEIARLEEEVDEDGAVAENSIG